MKTILVDAMQSFVIEGEGIYEPLHALLETYPNRKIVLTMAPKEKMEAWGLNDLPYEVFSSELDPKKLEPIYYETVLKRFGLSADDVVCFEHDPEAVASARSIGIAAHRYDSEKRDVAGLKEFLDTTLGT
jgi:HAD superfamily hydrolase (TIGR01509 family)